MRVTQARFEIGASFGATLPSESERRLHTHTKVGRLRELAILGGPRRRGREHTHNEEIAETA